MNNFQPKQSYLNELLPCSLTERLQEDDERYGPKCEYSPKGVCEIMDYNLYREKLRFGDLSFGTTSNYHKRITLKSGAAQICDDEVQQKLSRSTPNIDTTCKSNSPLLVRFLVDDQDAIIEDVREFEKIEELFQLDYHEESSCRRAVRFVVDENDTIVESICEYEKPPREYEPSLYISSTEHDEMRTCAIFDAEDFYLDHPDDVDALDEMVQACYYAKAPNTTFQSNGEQKEEDECDENPVDSHHDLFYNDEMLRAADEWAASSGRGLERILSEDLHTEAQNTIHGILSYQTHHRRRREPEELTFLCEKVNARARHLAWLKAQGDHYQAQLHYQNYYSEYKIRCHQSATKWTRYFISRYFRSLKED